MRVKSAVAAGNDFKLVDNITQHKAGGKIL